MCGLGCLFISLVLMVSGSFMCRTSVLRLVLQQFGWWFLLVKFRWLQRLWVGVPPLLILSE